MIPWLVGWAAGCGTEVLPAASERVSLDCSSIKGDTAARVTECLSGQVAAPLSKESQDLLADIVDDQSLLVVGPSLGLPHEIAFGPWLDPLLKVDEEGLATSLREQKIRGILVHRGVIPTLDRDRRMLSMLARHEHLKWFQLRRVTDDWMMYTVRSGESRISRESGTALVQGLRARLEGNTPVPVNWKPNNVRLIAGIRLQGQSLAFRHATGSNVEAVLDELADKLRRRWARSVEIDGIGTLDERLSDVRLELHVVLERAPVESRKRTDLEEVWELGIDGVILERGKERFTFLPGSEAVARSHKTAMAFLEHAADEGEWGSERPWEESAVGLDVIRGEHFMEANPGGEKVLRMFRGVPEVVDSEVTDAELQRMLIDGGEWWLRNQQEDGSFVYKYWPESHRFSEEYNEVRHAMGIRDMVDAWRYREDPRYLGGARKAMDWMLAFEVKDTDPGLQRESLPPPPPGTSLFRYPKRGAKKEPNQKLGTTAVALLGWVAWARATGSHEEDERIRRMARFVLAMREPNGRFDPYWVDDSHSYSGQKNDIVPGEAALALAEVADYFDDDEWISSFPSFLDYSEPWFRERASRRRDDRWPHLQYDNQDRLDLVQCGPWAVMASKAVYRRRGDERAAKFGLEVADWMIESYQWTSERSPWPDYVGGYFKNTEELPAMQTFCYAEGTAAALTIADRYRPEEEARYQTATLASLQFLRRVQYQEENSWYAPHPEMVHGGVKFALNQGKIRTDYVGHAMSTVSQYLDYRSKQEDFVKVVPTPHLSSSVVPSSLEPAEEDDDE